MRDQLLNELINENQDRRTFLKRSLFGLAILTASPAFTSGCASYPRVEGILKVFNNKEFLVLTGITEAFVASNDTGLPEPEKIGLAYEIDQFIATVSLESQKQLKLLLNIFEDYPLFFNGGLKKFTGMSLAEKQGYLDAWASSRLEFRQMAYSALKMFVMLIYYCKDETWEKIGYSGAQCLGGTT